MTSVRDSLSSLTLSVGRADGKILIAVDFGTTFSGLAWAQTRRPDVQTTITQWPDATSQGLEGISSDKVPTELRYTGNGYEWDFQIGEEEARYQWFKLDLDPSQTRGTSELARRYAAHKALPPGYDMSAEKLVRDYLTALRKHAEIFLKHKLPESALRSTLIEYIITTPAVWSDAAHAKTRVCAERAGMDAMDPHDIKIGDTFVLCDAGGGTVDLISYTVSALKPIFKIKEASPGTGGLCGSTYLNRIFREYLTAKLGDNENWEDEVMEDALRRFELVTKRAFTGNASESVTIPVPGLVDDPAQGVRKSKFTMKGSDIIKIFEPVLREILALVKGQIQSTKRKVKVVLLVGGSGQSSYLRNELRKALGSSIEVLVPPNGWTAVVRGALMKGLTHEAPELQTSQDRFSLCAQTLWITTMVEVYRERAQEGGPGDTVKEEEPIKFSHFKTSHVTHGPPQTVSRSLYACTDSTNKGAPVYKDHTVSDLVVLTADLSCIPEHTIEQRLGADGKKHYYLSYQIEMTNYSAMTKYELVYKGVRYASVKAEYVLWQKQGR